MTEKSRARKYQLTINNPIEKEFTHEKIFSLVNQTNWVYFCMCDEENETYHTHIFICFKNAVSFDRLKKLFPQAHIETAHGTCQQNRDYIRKEGKYADTEKKETNLIDTFEEYGEMPLDVAAKNTKVSDEVFQMIKDGYSEFDIIEQYPSYGTKIQHLQQMRQLVIDKEIENTWRDLNVTYIYGDTATGKTRFVMEKYGYKNVCKITNYKNPFDNYRNQDVILFDEFRSSILLSDMLQYLDGYPCRLSARYSDKTAVYTKVYIISNIPLNEQFKDVQRKEYKTYNAFVRRIHNIIKFENIRGEIIHFEEIPSEYFIEDNC